MELISELTQLRAVLQEYAHEAAEIYANKVALGDHVASGDLITTLRSEVVVDGQTFSVQLSLLNYWKYLEQGSKGVLSSPQGAEWSAHWPPRSALERWIEIKPVIPRPDARGRIPTVKSLAFLIGRKIYRHGTEPAHALADTIEQLNRNYEERFAVALAQDTQGYIARVLAFPSSGAFTDI